MKRLEEDWDEERAIMEIKMEGRITRNSKLIELLLL
jgi:hypothetical protein